ncbi:MAG: hypothetical protein KH284_08315 [Clostridiales bacterium]|nr:hypothetical protein [Clostridiales bacterium]
MDLRGQSEPERTWFRLRLGATGASPVTSEARMAVRETSGLVECASQVGWYRRSE